MEARNTGVSINYFIRGKTIFIRGQEWCADFIAKMLEFLNDSYNLSTILLSQHKFNVLNERRRQADVCKSHIACLLLFVGYNMWGCLKHKIGELCVRNQSPNLRQRHRWYGGNYRTLSLSSF